MATFKDMRDSGKPAMTSDALDMIEDFRAENDDLRTELRESLDKMDALFDRNWKSLLGGDWDDYEGPSLTQTKDASKRNREMSLNVHVKQGVNLISGYVWDGGIHYAGLPKETRGRGTNVQARVDSAINQRNFFSSTARVERTACQYYDGFVAYAGDDSDYSLRPVPVGEVTADYRNPDQADEIWAYRRSWTAYDINGDSTPKSEWIFVNAFKDKQGSRKSMRFNGKPEPIAVGKRLFVRNVNSISGWAYGLADVTPSIPWADQYKRAVLNGISMNESMASIWATAKSNTKDGAANAAIAVGGMNRAGGVAHIGASNELSVMSSAGAAYDFAKLFPILANFAAGIGVSAISLSSNPGNAGGSYGASKSLEKPEQVSTTSRRAAEVELDREVLVWLGADPAKLDIWFDPIKTEDELYRAIQANGLEWGFGTLKAEDLAVLNAQARGRTKPLPVPKDILIPNNSDSLARSDIDSDSTASANPANGGNFTPTQGSGQAFGSGGSGDQSSDDIRVRKD